MVTLIFLDLVTLLSTQILMEVILLIQVIYFLCKLFHQVDRDNIQQVLSLLGIVIIYSVLNLVTTSILSSIVQKQGQFIM
jgi:hypothetical protein